MIARVAPLCQGVGVGLAFKIGTGYVVQQQIVVEGKQLPQLLTQMFFQLLLVGQQGIQSPIQTVLVDLLGRHSQQFRQRAVSSHYFRTKKVTLPS